MQNDKGQECGSDAAVNGAAKPVRRDPLPPPEVAGMVFERPTPEMIEEFNRTFNEEEYLAGIREIEAGRGHKLEDFIDEIERIAYGGK